MLALNAFYLQFLFLWQPGKTDGIITILEKKKTKFQKVLPVVLYNQFTFQRQDWNQVFLASALTHL